MVKMGIQSNWVRNITYFKNNVTQLLVFKPHVNWNDIPDAVATLQTEIRRLPDAYNTKDIRRNDPRSRPKSCQTHKQWTKTWLCARICWRVWRNNRSTWAPSYSSPPDRSTVVWSPFQQSQWRLAICEWDGPLLSPRDITLRIRIVEDPTTL